jgi:hypothetical protein
VAAIAWNWENGVGSLTVAAEASSNRLATPVPSMA